MVYITSIGYKVEKKDSFLDIEDVFHNTSIPTNSMLIKTTLNEDEGLCTVRLQWTVHPEELISPVIPIVADSLIFGLIITKSMKPTDTPMI